MLVALLLPPLLFVQNFRLPPPSRLLERTPPPHSLCQESLVANVSKCVTPPLAEGGLWQRRRGRSRELRGKISR